MLRVRILEDGFLCDIFLSAERRESDDVGRKLALDVLPPIQSISVGYSSQRSREKEGFLGHRRDSFAYGGHQQLQNRAFEQVWILRDHLSCATLKRNRMEQHRMEIHGRDLKRMTKLLPKLVCIARAVVVNKEPHRAVTAIKVHVARSFLTSKKCPICALIRIPIETEIRIDKRKHQLGIEFLYQFEA